MKSLNVDFKLPDIVKWMQELTNNFTTEHKTMRDLDEAIWVIVNRYQQGIGEELSFEVETGEIAPEAAAVVAESPEAVVEQTPEEKRQAMQDSIELMTMLMEDEQDAEKKTQLQESIDLLNMLLEE